jgi:hypothetical protein
MTSDNGINKLETPYRIVELSAVQFLCLSSIEFQEHFEEMF